MQTVTNKYTERFVRTLASEMGGSACTALYPMTGAEAKRAVIRRSITMLQEAGVALLQSRRDKTDPITQVLASTGGVRIFAGKIVDVQRVVMGGFNRGEAQVAGLGVYAGQTLKVFFQNEFLAATVAGKAVATTPDLIMLLDSETGEAVTGELMRYGLRTTILGVACNPQWRTPAGIALAGPRYFGYEFDYVPVEVLSAPLHPSSHPPTRASG
jgi:hypothetical protein